MMLMTDEQRSLMPKPEVSRRGFAVTALAGGFAAAVLPVSAATITTDSEGLETGEVKVPVRDGAIPAYFARPVGEGRFPIVLVVQEIFGVHEHIKDVCRRFAKEGHFAVASYLYAREGDVSKLEINQIMSQVASKVPDAQVMSDLDATAAWAASTGHGDSARLGITGFCWGGRATWLYAAHNPDLKAAVAWYGPLTRETNELQPKNPIDVVPQLKCPVLGLYGGKDQGIPVTAVEALKAAMAKAGKQGEVVIYPEAGHGFNADYRPSYNEAAARDGWQRCLAWFKSNGAA